MMDVEVTTLTQRLEALRVSVASRRSRLIERLRRPAILPPAPLGRIEVGELTIFVDSIRLSGGRLVVSGQRYLMGGIFIGPKQATYRLLDPDGALVRVGPMDPRVLPITMPPSSTMRLTLDLEVLNADE